MERSFPIILCELRKEKGLSQKEAAAQLGVSQALLSHYEKESANAARVSLSKPLNSTRYPAIISSAEPLPKT